MSGRTATARKRRDLGRAVAVLFCAVFAVIGAVPLLLGVLVRTSLVRGWAASETSKLLARELGVTARYEVEVEAWPMMIALANVEIDANDGGLPFLRIERVAARPRPFSLLAGQLDVGEVEIDRPWIRAVVKDGQLSNLNYKLPPGDSSGSKQLPFTSLAVTEARLDLTVDEARALTEELDADVSVEEDGAIEAAVRAGGASLTWIHPMPQYPEEDAVDEDRICKLEVRARIEDDQVLVRRLAIAGSADFDPDPSTMPGCALERGDWRAFDVSLSTAHVSGFAPGGQLRAAGRVRAKVPLALAHRFAKAPHLTGSATLDVDVEYDGGKLPLVSGTLEAEFPGADGKLFSETLKAELKVSESAVRLLKIEALWGGGKVSIGEARVEPFAKGRPLFAGPIAISGIEFADLVRDLGAHPQAVVGWTLREVNVPEFKGTLEPLELNGTITAQTESFQVFDRSVRNPDHRRMIGLPDSLVRGTLGVRPKGVLFQDFTVDTARTHLKTSMMIEFKNRISLDVREGSTVDLAEISPLTDIPVSGVATFKASMVGPLSHPKLTGEVKVSDFVFAGLNVGQVESAKAEFEPLKLTLTDVRVRKGSSFVRGVRARFAFDEGPSVLVDADVDTREAPYLEVHDLLDVFGIDKVPFDGKMVPDPRFADIHARAVGSAHIHFVVGGPEDRCRTGFIRVDGDMGLVKAELFGEKFDDSNVDFTLVWDDRRAGANGMKIDVRSALLRKGEGSITATATVRHGGVLRAQAIASGIPIGSVDALKPWGSKFDGSVSATARIGGKLDAMSGLIDVEISRVRVGPSTLLPSRFAVEIVPKSAAKAQASGAVETEPAKIEERACDNSAGAPFEYSTFLADATSGDFVVNGGLFGDQIGLRDVRISQQKRKDVRGDVDIKDLDLGALANLVPGVAFSAAPPEGRLTASLSIKHAPITDIAKSDMTLSVAKLQVKRGGQMLKLLSQKAPITLAGNTLTVPGWRVEGKLESGLSGVLIADGKVERALTNPSLDANVQIEPLSLQRISADIPGVDRAGGQIEAQLRMQGPLDALRYSGAAKLKNGELYIKGLPVGFTDAQVDIDIGAGDARIKRATAKVGGGTISVTGGVPIHGTSLGTATAWIVAKNVKLPVADGVQLTADANLEASLRPSAEDSEERLPDVKGTVELTSFSYTRPIELAVNIGQLGSRSRTTVETYDPKNDVLRFDLNVISPKPLRFANNLIDMQLEVVEPGLALSGTNQRFGARGLLRIRPESKLRLRNTEFEVREGSVRFDDPNRIAPKVDVRATAEYRRSSTLTGPDAASQDGTTTTTVTSQTDASQSGGLWRITMHAYGNADALKVDLSSEPTLRQEDIVLLLTFGLTRAELDQGLASSVGQTVGLEALSALTGADKAVQKFVPVIDEFRFGTGYSQRTGRTQPMVTVGKRISDSVRATVSTGVSENREVKSTIEWRLSKGVSVQGSYDNSSDTFGLPFGNLGADLRWRIEFE